jgi:hypothetical protein
VKAYKTFLLFFGVFSVIGIFGGLHIRALNDINEKVTAHHHIMAGKAHYLPGKVCIIEAGPDTTTAEVVNYARACAKAHEEFLGESNENNQ